ncbi:MAG: hypothetical protein WAX29_10675, partial [Propionibacterium sp.]
RLLQHLVVRGVERADQRVAAGDGGAEELLRVVGVATLLGRDDMALQPVDRVTVSHGAMRGTG